MRISLPSRRGLARLALAAAMGAALPAAHASAQAQPSGQTLRVVLINDLTAIDPVFSQAAFVRNHGFFIYDQLFALDASFSPRPQMAEGAAVSADGRSWTIKLRPGLKESYCGNVLEKPWPSLTMTCPL